VGVPDYQTLMRPLLALTEDGQPHAIAGLRAVLADEFNLTREQLAERVPSGRGTLFQNRVGWAATYLHRCGLLDRPKRAHYTITERGRHVLAQHPERIDLSVLAEFQEFHEFVARRRPAAVGEREAEAVPEQTLLSTDETATPEERMERAYRELRSALASEVLDRVKEQSWEFFEDLVIDVLRAMGYGGRRGAAERLGGRNDEGIDGVIREDALGLDLIYVQAKKWAPNVQRPDLQRFFGALEGQRATKGVFITTSDFSPQAVEFARNASRRMVLINGEQLAELMIDHGVGVTVQSSYEVPRVDLDYFVEDDGASSADEAASPSVQTDLPAVAESEIK
jgi:restriction system protein